MPQRKTSRLRAYFFFFFLPLATSVRCCLGSHSFIRDCLPTKQPTNSQPVSQPATWLLYTYNNNEKHKNALQPTPPPFLILEAFELLNVNRDVEKNNSRPSGILRFSKGLKKNKQFLPFFLRALTQMSGGAADAPGQDDVRTVAAPRSALIPSLR